MIRSTLHDIGAEASAIKWRDARTYIERDAAGAVPSPALLAALMALRRDALDALVVAEVACESKTDAASCSRPQCACL